MGVALAMIATVSVLSVLGAIQRKRDQAAMKERIKELDECLEAVVDCMGDMVEVTTEAAGVINQQREMIDCKNHLIEVISGGLDDDEDTWETTDLCPPSQN